MKALSLAFAACLLSGCVDLGHVSAHPETTVGYFSGHRAGVEACLAREARHQRLRLEADDPLPGGVDRFNLLDAHDEAVAWVEVATASRRETSAQFYYAPDEPDAARAVAAMLARCGSISA